MSVQRCKFGDQPRAWRGGGDELAVYDGDERQLGVVGRAAGDGGLRESDGSACVLCAMA